MPRHVTDNGEPVLLPRELYDRIKALAAPNVKIHAWAKYQTNIYIIEIIEAWLVDHRSNKTPVMGAEHYTASHGEEAGDA